MQNLNPAPTISHGDFYDIHCGLAVTRVGMRRASASAAEMQSWFSFFPSSQSPCHQEETSGGLHMPVDGQSAQYDRMKQTQVMVFVQKWRLRRAGFAG
jgi:hypothetical protein